MKKISLVILFLVVSGLFLWKILPVLLEKPFTEEKLTISKKNTNNPSPALPINRNTVEIELKGKKIAVSWLRIPDPKRISLYSNFKDKLPAENFMKKNNCKSVINAGFYSKEGNPLGLFISNNTALSKEIQSTLFNGFFYIDNNSVAGIKRELPDINYYLALQSGPMLLENGKPLFLKIQDDETARRIVVAVNPEGNVFFLAFYDKESNLLGPYLSELPELVKKAREKINENFEIALNLDGGSASAFYSDGISLSEISSVGSFFCIQ